MASSLHHISIICSSESSVLFYEKLGFHEFFRRERGYDTVILMEGNGIRLEIYIDPNHPPRSSSPENLGIRHFSIKVDNFEKTISDLQLSTERIRSDWLDQRYCFIEDPDGLPVQLHE